MTSPASTLTLILDGIQALIARHMFRDRARAPMLHLLTVYIGRTVERFAALHARWRAGTLPAPRPARIRPARPHRAARTRLPATRAWIVHLAGFQAANRASQLAHLLARPDLADFFAQVPQAGRLLRPLCRMLGTALPPALTPPPRPRRPRPKPQPAPPAPEPRHGKYTPAAIRRYRPGLMPPLPAHPSAAIRRTTPT